MKFFLLILKNLRRNKIRSALTSLAVVFLVVIFSLIATVLYFLDAMMAEKSKDVKTIVTERYRIPSQFDRSYVDRMVKSGSVINQELSKIGGFDGEKHTIWHFVICSVDPEMKNANDQFFIIATLPEKIEGMVEGIEGLPPNVAELMRKPPGSNLPNTGLVLGPDIMKKQKLEIGKQIKVKCVSHREGTGLRLPLEFEFEVVASFKPDSIWSDASFMDYAYLDRILHGSKNEMDGKVNIAWFSLDDPASADQFGGVIQNQMNELRSETLSSAMSRQMGLFGGMLWGIKWLLTPAILAVMTVVLANSISMTVRERMAEMAVMKVLGYGRSHIMTMILGEGILLGLLAGLFSALATYGLINHGMGGLRMGQGMPTFFVPVQVIGWGAVIGIGTAILAGLMPAWNASRIKVSEVFSKVA